jgi:asparagine synthase (glutamine-hydrolysing)
MCGLVGIVQRDASSSPDVTLLEQMTASLFHRGPDGGGTYVNGAVGLGHRRLAIIDPRGGHQPLVHEQSQRALVYNGEIYNFRELRRELQTQHGIPFQTDCDTEVLLHIASSSEFRWLESLNGMFAFALWDERSKTLLLGRDRLGIKPLYYINTGGEFLFSSEIRSLLMHPKVARSVNSDRIPEYLAFRSISGVETMFKGIYQVPPGSVMVFDQQAFKGSVVKFWSEGANKEISNYVDPNLSFEQQFESLLLDSVRFRLISDVPVGTYNSGGVDSSLVTAMVRKLSSGELHTFSVGFEESDYDESPYAEIVARRLNTCHHSLIVTQQDYLNSYEKAVCSLEEPMNHAHSPQLLQLSQFAKQYVTVVLTGEGSDELFGGYPRFHIPLLMEHLSFLPSGVAKRGLPFAQWSGSRKLVKLLENAGDSVRSVTDNSRFTPKQTFDVVCPGTHHFDQRTIIYDEAKKRTKTLLGSMLYFDQRTYLPSLLNRLDKMSMVAAIECRVPFLDYRLVEWSAHVPVGYKVGTWSGNKIIVKSVARKWIPQEIVNRKKVGFGVPIGRWLRSDRGFGRYFDLLTDSVFKSRGYCDYKAVERLAQEHRQGKADHSEILWGLINLEVWSRMFVDAPQSSRDAKYSMPDSTRRYEGVSAVSGD